LAVAAGISGGAGSAIVAGGEAGIGSTAIPVGLGSVVATCAGAIYSGAGTQSLLKMEPFLLGGFSGAIYAVIAGCGYLGSQGNKVRCRMGVGTSIKHIYS
jgi:hypothetical protein